MDGGPDRSRRAFLTGVQTAGLVAVIVAGAILFCASNVAEIGAVVPVLPFALAMAVLGYLALFLRQVYSDHLAATHTGSRPVLHDAMADIVLVVVLTFTAMKICSYSFNHTHDALEWPASLLYFSVVVLCARLLRERNAGTFQSGAALVSAPPADAHRAAASELIYVEAEDHYVKMVYSDRVEHKRARFSDVTADLGDTGMRVHKSFWVNRAFVTGTRRSGRRLVLVLRDGVDIPVGRSMERTVVDALASGKDGGRAGGSSPVPAAAKERIRPGAAPPGP
ncbi:LytTR family DNA-binding domain-containing protein [Aestuariivirga sp.]|uniref:LytTR family DNA-binding domain-containing protein n=1 Tax=Aestuariivirga sp. TaxID=2650926 RepID=UPI0039E512F9